MKKIIFTFVLLAIVMSGFSQKKKSLFNGKDLKGWTVFVGDNSIKPADFFYVKDGYIETPGVPNGYLRTKQEFADYELHVEWCYPEKPINSGIFVHTNGPDMLWPAHFQCQLMHEKAGDFIVQNVGLQAKVRDSLYVSTEKVKPIAAKLEKPSENKPGEWNSCDIVCKGNTVSIKINGVLQNYATDCSLTKGGIGLQAEGTPIRFRNIWIRKIK